VVDFTAVMGDVKRGVVGLLVPPVMSAVVWTSIEAPAVPAECSQSPKQMNSGNIEAEGGVVKRKRREEVWGRWRRGGGVFFVGGKGEGRRN
jgi:hypothetical protein